MALSLFLGKTRTKVHNIYNYFPTGLIVLLKHVKFELMKAALKCSENVN